MFCAAVVLANQHATPPSPPISSPSVTTATYNHGTCMPDRELSFRNDGRITSRECWRGPGGISWRYCRGYDDRSGAVSSSASSSSSLPSCDGNSHRCAVMMAAPDTTRVAPTGDSQSTRRFSTVIWNKYAKATSKYLPPHQPGRQVGVMIKSHRWPPLPHHGGWAGCLELQATAHKQLAYVANDASAAQHEPILPTIRNFHATHTDRNRCQHQKPG